MNKKKIVFEHFSKRSVILSLNPFLNPIGQCRAATGREIERERQRERALLGTIHNPGAGPARLGRPTVDVRVQIRQDVRAHAYCPRHNEPVCVLLASPCTLWQPVQQQSATLQLPWAGHTLNVSDHCLV
jgi:hypothetical protein